MFMRGYPAAALHKTETSPPLSRILSLPLRSLSLPGRVYCSLFAHPTAFNLHRVSNIVSSAILASHLMTSLQFHKVPLQYKKFLRPLANNFFLRRFTT